MRRQHFHRHTRRCITLACVASRPQLHRLRRLLPRHQCTCHIAVQRRAEECQAVLQASHNHVAHGKPQLLCHRPRITSALRQPGVCLGCNGYTLAPLIRREECAHYRVHEPARSTARTLTRTTVAVSHGTTAGYNNLRKATSQHVGIRHSHTPTQRTLRFASARPQQSPLVHRSSCHWHCPLKCGAFAGPTASLEVCPSPLPCCT